MNVSLCWLGSWQGRNKGRDCGHLIGAVIRPQRVEMMQRWADLLDQVG